MVCLFVGWIIDWNDYYLKILPSPYWPYRGGLNGYTASVLIEYTCPICGYRICFFVCLFGVVSGNWYAQFYKLPVHSLGFIFGVLVFLLLCVVLNCVIWLFCLSWLVSVWMVVLVWFFCLFLRGCVVSLMCWRFYFLIFFFFLNCCWYLIRVVPQFSVCMWIGFVCVCVFDWFAVQQSHYSSHSNSQFGDWYLFLVETFGVFLFVLFLFDLWKLSHTHIRMGIKKMHTNIHKNRNIQ